MTITDKTQSDPPVEEGTEVVVRLPDQTIRDLASLAERKKISRTEALIQAVETTRELVTLAPHGAKVVPLTRRERAAAKIESLVDRS